MDTNKAEYDILKILILAFCIEILALTVGMFVGKVSAQFLEGLISGSFVGMIITIFKDLFVKNQGGSNVSSDSEVLPKPVQESSSPKV